MSTAPVLEAPRFLRWRHPRFSLASEGTRGTLAVLTKFKVRAPGSRVTLDP